MAPRRPVRNAGTYEMGRPVNQGGGSARNRPVATSGALQRLAVGRNANPYAGADAGMWTGAYKGETPQASKIGAWQGDTPAADPYGRQTSGAGFGRGAYNAPSASVADWAAIDGGSLGGIRRGSTTVADTNDYANADAGVLLAALNNSGGGGGGVATPAPSVTGGVATASPAPKVNPLDAIYQNLFETIGQNTEQGVAGFNDLLTRLGAAYDTAGSNIQGRVDERNAFWDGQQADLVDRVATQRAMGNQNMQNYQDALSRIVNPYGEGFAPSLTTTNQMADYLRATGVDPSQVDAMVAQASAENAQYDQMLNRADSRLGGAFQQAMDMQAADALLMGQGFDQDLAGQQNALTAAMTSQRGNEIAGLNSDLSNLGLTRIGQELGINTDLLNFQNSQGQSLANAQLDQVGNTQQYDANSQNQSMTLLNNILNAYGGDLDPASVVELVTKFARTMGMPASQVMGAV